MVTEARILNYLLGLVIRCALAILLASAFPGGTRIPVPLVLLWILFLLWPWRGPQVA
jgi:hypothetical protein